MKALTIGGAMVDTIAIIESERIERMKMQNADTSFLLLEEGRKLDALEISTHCGGGAINAAVAMARLGLDVSTLAKLGTDHRAELILARLEQEGVSARWIARDERAPTGASVLVSSHERNAAIFTYRGANTLLTRADLPDAAFAADLVYVAGLSNQSAACFPDIIRAARAHGALIAANPGIRQLSARSGPFRDAVRHIDILALNRHEADTLVPSLVTTIGEGGPALPLDPGEEPPPLAARGLVGGGYQIALASFLHGIRQLGPRIVVLTDGRGGAFVGVDGSVLFCPARQVQALGTAGAGDAFAATFAAFIALGRPADVALRAATFNAAAVVTFADTQSGLLRLDALDSLLQSTRDPSKLRRWQI